MSRSLQQVLTRLERLEVLYRISNLINTTLEPQEILRLLLDEVVRITNATSGSIAMVDQKRGVLNIETAINIPQRVWKTCKLEMGVGVTGYCAWSGKPVRVTDVTREPRYVRLKSEIRSELALPMLLQNRVIGVINVDSTRPDAFSEEDEELGMAVANQSAKVIETARLHSAVKRSAAEMERLFAVGSTLIQPGPIDDILRRLVEEALALLKGKVCALHDVAEGQLRIRAIAGANPRWAAKDPVSVSSSLLGQVVRRRTPVKVPDVRRNGKFRHADLAEQEGLVSLLAVPVAYQDSVLAVLALYTGELRRFRDTELRLLQLLGNQGALAIENARRTDRLTQLEESVRRSERFSLLGTLAAEIAHEIRNPITIINLLMHSIRENAAHTDQTREDLRIVTEKLDRINHIVEQTLNIARSGDSNFQPTDINALLEELLLFLSHKLAKAGIKVVKALDQKIGEAAMDPGQIQQVLLNLMVNAIEAMPGGGTLTVRTRRGRDKAMGDHIRCSVGDTGVGIPDAIRDKLFDAFYTTRDGGTGLGLFVSNKLVRRHNGTIRIRSMPGMGSTFTLTLPLHQEGATP